MSRRLSKVLITGAAGFIGSHLTFRLLERGARVWALARPHGNRSALERLAALRSYFGYRGPWPDPRLTVVEADLALPWLGLPEAAARRLVSGVDQVIHCAARLDFAADRRAEVFIDNLEVLDRLRPLLARGPVFNFVSTAYVHGAIAQVGGERPVPLSGSRFRNAYEESKARAEERVRTELEAPWRIIRPAIVVGERGSGRTLRFETLYVLLKILDELHRKPASGRRLRVRCSEAGGLNLVPIDFVTEATLELVADPRTLGGIFQLVNPKPLVNRELADLLSAVFPELRLEAAEEDEFDRSAPNARERLIDRGLAAYRPYLESNPRFDDARAREILAPREISCPPFDRTWLENLLAYARSADWGRCPSPEPAGDGSQAYCERYFDGFLGGRVGEALLPDGPNLSATFAVEVTDLPAFRRTIEVRDGRIWSVTSNGAAVQWSYQLESDALRRIARATLDPRQAFFSRRAEIRGDVEAGLRMATVMIDFFRRMPFEDPG